MDKNIADNAPKKRAKPLLSILVPCYNEAETLPSSLAKLDEWLAELIHLGMVQPESFLCLVDDGSSDATWSIISQPSDRGIKRVGIRFAGNAGHQNALVAGMLELADWVDCLITIDADLQDDLQAMRSMLAAYTEGKCLVYGVRDDRTSDSLFKRWTAWGFYTFMQLLGTPAISQHADYRLVSREALMALKEYPERNIFLRGIFPSLGFPSAIVTYSRQERQHGTTKYPLRKMFSFAWQGITSFSSTPLRLAGLTSVFIMLLAFAYGLLSFYNWLCGITVTGWTSLVIIILFLSSVQLFCISLVGEYIAKLFTEVKRRPRYLIAERAGEWPQ